MASYNMSILKMMEFLFLITLTFTALFSTASGRINCSSDARACCSNEVWDPKVNECVVCNVGFVGEDCKDRCRYPYFGMTCLNMCRCNKMDCDFQIGCSPLQGSTRSLEENADQTEDLRMQNTTPVTVKHTYMKMTLSKDENENQLLYLVLGFGVVLLICIIAYAILKIYSKIKNIQSEDQERRSIYAKPNDIVTLHI